MQRWTLKTTEMLMEDSMSINPDLHSFLYLEFLEFGKKKAKILIKIKK